VTAVPAGEFEVIARIQQRLRGEGGSDAALRAPEAGEVFSGDDTAVVSPGPSDRLLLAIDLVVEDVHVDLALASLADMGWKAVSVNASDIAAMGGRPLHVVVGVAAPPSTDLDAITDGMVEACAAYGIALVGGDLTGGRNVVISVAITGTCDGRPPVLRSGARPGDVIWVTGPLGASAAGLALLQGPGGLDSAGDTDARVAAYRRPVARVAEGIAAATAGATAMIDVSDGLSRDLDHIARQSGVGIRLESLPVVEGATAAEALGGGEDYELVFTASVDAGVAEAFRAAGLRAPIEIGTCSDDGEERTLQGQPLAVTGWEHRFGAASA
jgi:thiamine-monophosphate kinase